jgi:hypothetical protein
VTVSFPVILNQEEGLELIFSEFEVNDITNVGFSRSGAE